MTPISFDRALPKIIRIGQQVLPPEYVGGEKIPGTGFSIDESNEQFFRTLWEYFTRDEEALRKRGYSCRRGLMIMGTYGTGKTAAMEIFAKITGLYRVIPTRQILREYRQQGDGREGSEGVLDRYTYMNQVRVFVDNVDIGVHPEQLCFDDWGHESAEARLYGNSINVMEEILSDRYVLWRQRGMITHVTTNMGSDEVEKTYGGRIRDRCREMFNLIPLTGESRRRQPI
jgi:hypothetical protein